MVLGVIGELMSSLLEDDICGVTLSIRYVHEGVYTKSNFPHLTFLL